MEGEREEQGEITQSGTTSTQVDTLTQNCSEESDVPQKLQESEEDDQADNGPCDGEEDSDPLAPPPSSGQKVSYQTDPRPHFGVAWSSHSTCRPLWGSEGPCWGRRTQAVSDQTHICPHCHLGLPPDTLRWHEFSGRMSKYRRDEGHSAVAYVRSMGVYLRRLQVLVYPPHRNFRAQRLEQAINDLLTELLSQVVRAPLQSFPLVGLELDRPCWSVESKNSILVSGDLWASLASSCSNLKVKFSVHQVINNNHLARILLPEIPLTEFTMTAFYAPDTDWSPKPLLRDMLPQYRHSLQYLFLILTNNEPLDLELLQLMRIYTLDDDIKEQKKQLNRILSCYLLFPPELKMFATVHPFIDS
ncbi:F-box only protein 39 [Collichthys lucidus]|uniref:F-box only protein 39 n=1 Tax=Collichthys lucidus TaxID=240159 RepID=A0A4U5V4Y0_COLLU|nr:F-box only protein 39 [Collichthys lucidus]